MLALIFPQSLVNRQPGLLILIQGRMSGGRLFIEIRHCDVAIGGIRRREIPLRVPNARYKIRFITFKIVRNRSWLICSIFIAWTRCELVSGARVLRVEVEIKAAEVCRKGRRSAGRTGFIGLEIQKAGIDPKILEALKIGLETIDRVKRREEGWLPILNIFKDDIVPFNKL